MFKLLKKLFSTRKGNRTVVIIDEDGSKPSTSHRLHPVRLWLLFSGIIVGVIILVFVLIRFTPLGGLIYNQRGLRKSVIAVQRKVASLQDTILARNLQLRQMQHVIATGTDTSVTALKTPNDSAYNKSSAGPGNHSPATINNPVMYLPSNAKLIANFFKKAPSFPAPYPLEGAPTRTFNIRDAHYGLDIAASSGSSFKAIADGVIVSEEWTFNYGYLIIVQHAGGVISIYKHAQTLAKSIGETVRQGDILGTIGNVGILSSGPHLHIEIWENGIPQNPENYLIHS